MSLLRPMLLAPFAVVLLTACDDPTRPAAGDAQLAAIGGYAEPNVVVSVDDDGLLVHITTYGNSCTTAHHDDVEVDDDARLVTIRPYNEVEGKLCFMSLEEIPHEVRVDVEASGDWLVRVIGTGMPTAVGPDAPPPPTIVIERDVHVAIANPG